MKRFVGMSCLCVGTLVWGCSSSSPPPSPAATATNQPAQSLPVSAEPQQPRPAAPAADSDPNNPFSDNQAVDIEPAKTSPKQVDVPDLSTAPRDPGPGAAEVAKSVGRALATGVGANEPRAEDEPSAPDAVRAMGRALLRGFGESIKTKAESKPE